MIDALFEPAVLIAVLLVLAAPVAAAYGALALFRRLRARWARRRP